MGGSAIVAINNMNQPGFDIGLFITALPIVLAVSVALIALIFWLAFKDSGKG